MSTDSPTFRLVLEPESPQRLANLCGLLNEHLHQIEARLDVRIRNRGNLFMLSGQPEAIDNAATLLRQLYTQTATEPNLSPDLVHLAIQESTDRDWLKRQNSQDTEADTSLTEEALLKDDALTKASQTGTDNVPTEQTTNDETNSSGAGLSNDTQSDSKASQPDYQVQILRTPKCSVKPRSKHQNLYVNRIMRNDINFGIGPAGTGKTYLAVACAVEALISERVERILLVRPAVEAGEKLGFLPGDLAQKVDPYLRPLYDALYEMLGFERVAKLIERNIIEIAPLAYMRGRTLNNSFVILDESQNTTGSQMKMFLTRIGFGSTAVITGDVTQIDLPKGTRSGLVHVSKVLDEIEGISFSYFNSADVVRHPIVQKVVEAYDAHDHRQTVSRLKHNQQDNDRLYERDS